MALNEDVKLKLDFDGNEAQTTFELLTNEAKEINKQLRAMKENGEVGSEGWNALKSRQGEVSDELKEMKRNLDLSSASINQMQEALTFWTREAKKAEQGSDDWITATKKIAEIRPVLNDAQSELRSFGTEVEKQPGLWDNMKAAVLAVFTGTALWDMAKQAGQIIFDIGMDIFETTAKFEKYETVLKTALGTQEAATSAMSDIKKIAAETPFSVDELTESYIKYVNRGLQPSMAEMTKLGDIAASQGKSFSQLTEAVLDAGTGEFERLKEFGIQASKSGDQVSLSFKGVNETIAFTPEAIQGAILGFGEMEGVVGGMAAISSTLEGRVSNLGDQYDALKLVLGDALMPVFDLVLSAMKDGITFITDLVSGNISLSDSTSWLASVFNSLWEILGTVWDTVIQIIDVGAQLFVTLAKISDGLFETSGGASFLENVLHLLSGAFKIVGSVLIATITGLEILAEGFNIVVNEGKKLANYFGSDFKIDTSATWANLNKHAEENIAGINDLWKKSGDETIKVHEKVTDSHKKSVEKQTSNSKAEADKQKKEADKLAKDIEKAESDLQKKIADMGIKAIADDTKRKVAQANLNYKRELDNITKSKANEATKNKAIEALEKAHEAEILKISDDARKKEKAEQDKAVKAKEAEDKKAAAEVKKTKDQALVDSKALLDAEFTAKINNAKISLALVKKGAQGELDAKKALLDQELEYKKANLNAAADAERNRITESISSNETKAARLKAVDDKLSSELILNETTTQAEKNKLDKAATKEKEKRKDEFYKGLDLAMKGDLKGFIAYLKEKAKNEGKHFDERLEKTAKNAEQIGGIMLTAVNTLMDLNKKYTDDKIAKLTKEKETNIKKLQDEYDKGILTKEQLDAKMLDLDNKFKDETQVLRKKEFERGKKLAIAQALIQGSLAVLSALATPPIFLGLAMAITAGVKTALDIKKIKNQKFEGASGGTYFKNAGIARGGRHGSKYGEGGIAMYDRATGNEVGEIEGDEPVMVLSRNTYKNNGPLIEKLLHSSLHRNGEPITMADGGIIPLSDFKYGEMMLFGSKKRKAKAAAAEAEAAASADYGSSSDANFDAEGAAGDSNAIIAKNTKISEETAKAAKDTADNTKNIADTLEKHSGILERIANKDSGASSLLHAIQRVQDNISKATLK